MQTILSYFNSPGVVGLSLKRGVDIVQPTLGPEKK